MQIVKGDHNSQLRKDEEIYLRKMNSQGSMARKLKNDPQSRVPHQWGGVVENTMAGRGRYHGCPGEVPCNTQSKEETGEKGEAKDQMPRTCRRAEH